MKTNYTDTKLQAAIDEACDKLAQSTRVYLNALDLDNTTESWPVEASARLDLIKSALAALPEPVDEESMLLNLLAVIHRDGGHYQAEHGTRKAVQDACKEWQRLILIAEKTGLTEPPTVDGKTPGQVCFEAWKAGYPWDQANQRDFHRAASAVLAAFGKQSQPQLSQLRPLAEAGEVPEGCVRYYTYKKDGDWTSATKHRAMQDTHFVDVQLPAAKADEPAKAETFEAHGKTWNVHNKGDTLPCDGNILVEVIDGDIILNPVRAESWNWRSGHFRGWRYADKPTPEPLVTKPISLPLAESMSLRDWFAGQALVTLYTNAESDADKLVEWTYQIADAMLKAREVKP